MCFIFLLQNVIWHSFKNVEMLNMMNVSIGSVYIVKDV